MAVKSFEEDRQLTGTIIALGSSGLLIIYLIYALLKPERF